jgi:hypothetical protein
MKLKFLWRDGTRPTPTRQLVRRALLSSACALALGLAPAACATSHARSGATDAVSDGKSGSAPQVVVQLTNDLDPPSDVTVYAVSNGGFRQRLGEVPPTEKQALRFPIVGATETVRLVAERDLGRSVRSQPIVLNNNATTIIDWDLSTNSIWFPKGGQE